jgi:hypothetical protein
LCSSEWADLKDEHGNRRLDDSHDKVRFEISQAFLRNLQVIPVSVDGAPVPKPTQLPDNIMQLSHYQAMLLRTESFASDSAAIAQRLKAALVARRPRGVPTWAAGVAAVATLIAGIAAGPLSADQFAPSAIRRHFARSRQANGKIVPAVHGAIPALRKTARIRWCV